MGAEQPGHLKLGHRHADHPFDVPSPHAEAARLAVLRASRLLESGPEPAFDRLTRMASKLLGVDIALVTLVDEDRLRFKSQVGLDPELAARGELPLSHAFCLQVVTRDAPVVIEDARKDPDWWLHPACTELGLVAYAGIPLRLQRQPLGALCVASDVARSWTRDEIDALGELAAAAASELELRRVLAELGTLEADAARRLDALADSEARMAAVLSSALDMIVTVGADGRIVDWNPAAERTLGWTRAEAAGRALAELIIPPDMREAHARGFARQVQTGRSTILGQRVEVNVQRRDGTLLPVELVVTRAAVDGEPLFVAYLRDLSAVLEAREAQEEAESRYRSLVEGIPAVTYAATGGDAEELTYVSPQIEGWTGYPPESWVQRAGLWRELIHPDDRERVVAAIARGRRDDEPLDVEYRLGGPGGTYRHVWQREVIMRDADGRRAGSQGVLLDVSELRSAQAALATAEHRIAAVVQSAPMILFAFDADGIITLSEGERLRVLGLEPGAAVGHSVLDPAASPPAAVANCRRVLAGEAFSALVELGPYTFETYYSPLRDADGVVTGAIGAGIDVTARLRTEEQLAHLARHDRLTGLPNRAELELGVERAVARAHIAGGQVALLHLDLDGFRSVNDALGHATGDAILVALAERVRDRGGAGRLLARPGGDELLLLLPDLGEDAREVAEREASELLARVAPPFVAAGAELPLGASVGISLFPADARTGVDLLRHAEIATHQAKRDARGGFALYCAADDDAAHRLEATTRLRRALADEELEVHYQPIHDVASGRITAVEALLRWRDPERGLLTPGAFLALAEDTGLIEPIGNWAFDVICRQAARWRDDGIDVHVNVNLSLPELLRWALPGHLAERVRHYRLEPARFNLEITESTAMSDVPAAGTALQELRAAGFRLALDDFGAGFSSLGRLRELPCETVKIDRSLLRDVPEDPRATGMMRAILGLVRDLELEVVAEGVETEAQLAFLAEAECASAQGFHLGRPAPAGELTPLLAAQSAVLSRG